MDNLDLLWNRLNGSDTRNFSVADSHLLTSITHCPSHKNALSDATIISLRKTEDETWYIVLWRNGTWQIIEERHLNEWGIDIEV